MKKKFGKALTMITADIVAAPDLSDSNSDIGMSLQPGDAQLTASKICHSHVGDDRFGYGLELWKQMEEESKVGGTKYYLPQKISDESVDELYLGDKNRTLN